MQVHGTSLTEPVLRQMIALTETTDAEVLKVQTRVVRELCSEVLALRLLANVLEKQAHDLKS